jgi:hypothetical protein
MVGLVFVLATWNWQNQQRADYVNGITEAQQLSGDECGGGTSTAISPHRIVVRTRSQYRAELFNEYGSIDESLVPNGAPHSSPHSPVVGEGGTTSSLPSITPSPPASSASSQWDSSSYFNHKLVDVDAGERRPCRFYLE